MIQFRVTLSAFGLSVLCAMACGAAARDDSPNAAARKAVSRAMDAMGGEAALRAIRSAHFKAFDESRKPSMPFEIWVRDPDRVIVRADSPDGMREDGYNGIAGWHIVIDGDQYSCIAAKAPREGLRDWCFIHRIVLDFADDRLSLETGPDVEMGGRPCHTVALKLENRKRVLYIDSESGVPIGLSTEGDPGLRHSDRVSFGDWHEIDGVKIPFSIDFTDRLPDHPSKMRLTAAEFNKVDIEVFQSPQAVRQLLAHDLRPSRGRPTSPPPTLSDEQIAKLSIEEATEMLTRIADARQFTANDPVRDAELKVQMRKVLDRIRFLRFPDFNDAPRLLQPEEGLHVPPAPLTPDEIRAMTFGELRVALARISDARRYAGAGSELEARLKAEMNEVFKRMKQLKQEGQ